MNAKDNLKNRADYYELALHLAAAKARQDEFRWERFIDDLSNICDRFAAHIASQSVQSQTMGTNSQSLYTQKLQ